MNRGRLACSVVCVLAGCSENGSAPRDAGPPDDAAPPPDAAPATADAGAALLVAGGQPFPGALAVGATHVYFLIGGDATTPASLRRVPKSGGAVEVLAMGGGSALALDDANVYWLGTTDCTTANATVLRTPLGGGATTQLSSAERCPTEIVVGGGFAYWTRQDAQRAFSVVRAPVGGGAPTPFAACEAGLALDAAFLYCDSFTDGLRKFPVGGGAPVLVTKDSLLPTPFGNTVVDDRYVYWSTGNDPGLIARADKNGGAPEVLVDPLLTILFPRDMVLDPSGVFFVEQGSFKVPRVTPGIARVAPGGAVTVLAPAPEPTRLAADATDLYFSVYQTGSIYKMSR